MNFSQFQDYVRRNGAQLDGVCPETADNLSRYEATLGFGLPRSMKWLLASHGYSSACGIDDLENSVKLTQECRAIMALPADILIINDWNDGGVVLTIRCDVPDADYPMYWGDAYAVHALAAGEQLPIDTPTFSNFAAWVVERVEFEQTHP